MARAAASLTPSPTMATTRPSACRSRDGVDLALGQHPGHDLGRCRPRRPPRAPTCSWSPVSSTGSQAERRAAGARPRRRSSLTVSATSSTPRARPSQPATTAVRPAASGVRRRLPTGRRARASPWSASSSGRPTRTSCPSTVPRTPSPSRLREPAHRGMAGRRRPAPARDRVLRGGLERAGQPAHDVGVLARRPRRRSTSAISPVVTVPVLSSTTVSMRRVASSTSGPWIRMPSWAPRPVPTISAVGVASPSAHGQAMISTATAAVNAVAGSAPVPSQKPSVATASAITTGTKTPEMRSASRCTWVLPCWASSTRRAICASWVSLPTRVARTTSAAAGVHGRTGHRRRPGRPRPAPTRRSASRRRRPTCRSRRRRRWRPSRPGRTTNSSPTPQLGRPGAASRRRRAAPRRPWRRAPCSARSAAPACRFDRFSNQRPASRNVVTPAAASR